MNWKHKFQSALSPSLYNHFFYYYLHLKNGQVPKILDLRSPKTFTEKIIWLKMNQHYNFAGLFADKIRVKDYVADKIGAHYIIPTLGTYETASEIDFAALPESFILKANHGSGWNIICLDKSKCDWEITRSKLEYWLSTNYYDLGKEYQYRDIKPKLLWEELLENTPDTPLIDYKIHCFSGNPTFIQVDLDRFTKHTRNFYDLDWNLVPFTTLYPLGKRLIPRPAALSEMLDIAQQLSENLKCVRIDLYFHKDKVYFSEITFHHGGGFEPFFPSEYDHMLGDLIIL